MNSKQQRLVAVVAVLAIIALIMNRSAPPPKEEPKPSVSAVAATPKAPSPGPRDFLVAKVNLNPAEVSEISTDQVELLNFPENVPVPESAAKYYDKEVKGKVLASAIYSGEVILRTRLASSATKVAGRKLREVIPQGYRAIALDVDQISGSAGFISQGDIVDVVATYLFAGRQMTRIILQSVEVLARGPLYNLSPQKSPERIIRGLDGQTAFTLRVTPQMAARVAHLINGRGANRFRLLLKNRDDRTEVLSRGVLLSELVTGRQRPRLSKEQQDAEVSQEIEVLRGQGIRREGSPDLTELSTTLSSDTADSGSNAASSAAALNRSLAGGTSTPEPAPSAAK